MLYVLKKYYKVMSMNYKYLKLILLIVITFFSVLIMFEPLSIELSSKTKNIIVLNDFISFESSNLFENNIVFLKSYSLWSVFHSEDEKIINNINIFIILAYFSSIIGFLLFFYIIDNNLLNLLFFTFLVCFCSILVWITLMNYELKEKATFFNTYYGKNIFFEKVFCTYKNFKIYCDAKLIEDLNKKNFSLNELIAYLEFRKDVLNLYKYTINGTEKQLLCNMEKTNEYPFVNVSCSTTEKAKIYK